MTNIQDKREYVAAQEGENEVSCMSDKKVETVYARYHEMEKEEDDFRAHFDHLKFVICNDGDTVQDTDQLLSELAKIRIKLGMESWE